LGALIIGVLFLSLLGAITIVVAYRHDVSAIGQDLRGEAALMQVLSTVQDAETGQRGYLLTGDPVYLQPYEQAQGQIAGALHALQIEISDQPNQLRRLATLRALTSAKLRELTTTVELRRRGEIASANQRVTAGDGRRLMDQLRTTVAAMHQEMTMQLNARAQRATLLGRLLVAVLAIPSGGLIALLFLTVRASRRETMRATSELGEINSQFALVLENATDYAVMTFDPGGRIRTWSRGAELVFGRPSREMLGQSVEVLFTEEDRAAGVPQLEMQAARAVGRGADDRWQLKGDGGRFWASGEVQPIRSTDGQITGFLKIVRDRTIEHLELEAQRSRADLLAAKVGEHASQQRQLESQVRQLQKLEGLGQLIAGIAHDFNNMLAVVIGALDLVRRRHVTDNPALGGLIDAAHEGATRATTLTRRLLAFSRQQPLSPSVIDLNGLVAGTSELSPRTLGESIEIETVLAGGLWRVNADAHEVENVIVNLAVNARDAMPQGGQLTIETANAHLDDRYAAENADVQSGQFVVLSVSDTGVGMAPEVLAKAFDPFFTTKGVGKGTGLGLSQVYGFAHQSGGHVKIYSELGHGTTVKLYLPRWHGAERPAAPFGQKADLGGVPHGSPSEIILVVEDEDRVRMLSVEALRELGYTVLHAADGDGALEILTGRPGVTLLFTDIVMPGATGRQLAAAAQKINPGLRVLYTTGYTGNAVVHGGVLDPGVAFIAKPFSIDALARKVRRTIDGAGAHRPAFGR